MTNPLAELEAWWEHRGQNEEECETVLHRYSELDDGILLEFGTVGGEDTARLERAEWTLDIGGVEDAGLCWEYGEPQWHEDHVLLLPYDANGAILSFAKPFNDPLRAWGAVAQAHRAHVGDWFPLERFFRISLLHEDFGELAHGPMVLLKVYADALRPVGEDVGYAPLAGWSRENSGLGVITWGRSYFIARWFTITRRE